MALLTPPPAAPQRGDRTTFANRLDAFITWLINFVSELLALVANLNTIAAGGAYAIPFTFATAGAGNGGKLTWPGYSGPIYFDTTDSRGSSIATLISTLLTSSSSAIKGSIRICKTTDPGSWILLDITGYTQFAQYGTATTSFVGSVGSILPGDPIMVYLERTGDKGDIGSTKIMLLRETLATGTVGPGLTAATWNQRALNTTNWNNISGASLGAGGAGTFRLPPGDYVVLASAVALTTTSGTTLRQAIRLYNRTTSVPYDVSGTEVVNNYTSGGYATARPSLRTALTVSSTTDYSIDHYVSIAATGGLALNVTGYSESYTEVMVLKVA